MTDEERRFRHVEWQLEENSCHCAAVPELHCMQAVKPDFQPEAAFKLWIEKLNQPIKTK